MRMSLAAFTGQLVLVVEDILTIGKKLSEAREREK